MLVEKGLPSSGRKKAKEQSVSLLRHVLTKQLIMENGRKQQQLTINQIIDQMRGLQTQPPTPRSEYDRPVSQVSSVSIYVGDMSRSPSSRSSPLTESDVQEDQCRSIELPPVPPSSVVRGSGASTFSDAQRQHQRNLLREALDGIENQAKKMGKCLDEFRFMEGAMHATIVVYELRTVELSATNYFQLYSAVRKVVLHLEESLIAEIRKIERVPQPEELVTYAENIVARLYMSITTIAVKAVTRRELGDGVLSDIERMAHDLPLVRDPLRQFFLRHFILHITAELLSGENGKGDYDVANLMNFVLRNFGEMTKLGVEIQYDCEGQAKDDAERAATLIADNLRLLSKIESLCPEKYSEVVLPSLLEHVESCGDAVVQEYLMKAIIDVFPGEFLRKTLHRFLSACAELQNGVDVKGITTALIDRLVIYGQKTQAEGGSLSSDLQLFDIFSERVEHIILTRKKTFRMGERDTVALRFSVLIFAAKLYPERVDSVQSEILKRLEPGAVHTRDAGGSPRDAGGSLRDAGGSPRDAGGSRSGRGKE